MGDDLKSRRTVFAGVGAGGLALALTACGAGGETTTAAPATSEPAASAPATSSAPAAAEGLAKTADIPVGGGKIFKEQKIVVTQPTEGEFKAFSASCTHQGCAVASIENGLIDCPCHGSKFKIEDGSVTQGPATKPLPAQEIKVDGDQITLA
ncbi:Rieske (2Fe-2S) protein [Nonomuraea sp. ZG12]|uniref:Rieske (2Fe-2S) protein n=1 Tax=Nonomuraea sp. ZG12 TaxID=3452207 RepID=UPI003F8B07D1